VVKADFLKLPDLIKKARENRQDDPAAAEVDDIEQDDQPLHTNNAQQLSLF
jgi:hypothetical protein